METEAKTVLNPLQVRRYEAARLAARILRAKTPISSASLDPGSVINLASYILKGD